MTPTVYKSKISITLFLIVTVCFVVMPALGPITGDLTTTSVCATVVLWLIFMPLEAYIYTSTRYIIAPGTLTVRSFLVHEKIKISDITRIVHTHTWLSAPALSLHRIELRCKRGRSIVISPRHEDRFIAQLTEQNPGIEVL